MPDFLKDAPIYTQLVSLLKQRIVSGEYTPGERIPAIRELALLLEVTPNTVQRALGILEQEKLLFTERTNGKFVTTDASRIRRLREELLKERVGQTVRELLKHGYSPAEIADCLQEEMRTHE